MLARALSQGFKKFRTSLKRHSNIGLSRTPALTLKDMGMKGVHLLKAQKHHLKAGTGQSDLVKEMDSVVFTPRPRCSISPVSNGREVWTKRMILISVLDHSKLAGYFALSPQKSLRP